LTIVIIYEQSVPFSKEKWSETHLWHVCVLGERWFLTLLLAVVFILPLALLRSLHSLQVTSSLSVIAMLIFACMVIRETDAQERDGEKTRGRKSVESRMSTLNHFSLWTSEHLRSLFCL
jgi:amino acid permease